MKTPLKGIEIKDNTKKGETIRQPTLIDMQQNDRNSVSILIDM